MTTANVEAWDVMFGAAVDKRLFPRVFNRTLLFGWPRTGKSTITSKLFPGQPIPRITFHKHQPVDDLIGGLGLVDGTTKWLDGPAVRAMREGLPLIADEIDRHSAEQFSFLLAILDDPAGVTLPTGERVNAAPGYGVVATSNELPSHLPDALYDRFDLILKCDSLSNGLKAALGDLADPAEAAMRRGTDKGYSTWTRPASVNLFIAASKLRRAGLSDDQIAFALGLQGQEAADFMVAIARKAS